MKYSFYIIRWMLYLAAGLILGSCTEDDATSEQKYGYLQFHIEKSTTRSELEHLADASKIRVDLVAADGNALSQTLTLSAFDNTTAELGMQSERWMLLAGTYQIAGYEVYDAVEQPLVTRSFETAGRQMVQVDGGGITLHALQIAAATYGKVQFRLVKDNAKATRAEGVKKYPFHQIMFANVTVKCLDDNIETKVLKLKMNYETRPSDDDPNHATGVCVCDSLVALPAGEYRVVGFETFFDKACTFKLKETSNDVSENHFVVEDRKTSRADVPITLDEASDYIKDAYVLREIWLALDGPNWSYQGKEFPVGSNWEFDNRDVDLWSAQPGVQIMENGRVALLSFAGFGAKGDMPAALGELADLRVLYIGTHNDDLAFTPNVTTTSRGAFVTDEQLEANALALRKSFNDTYVTNGHPFEILSPELQQAIELNGTTFAKSAHPLRKLSLTKPVNYVSQITSLPEEIGQLKQLSSLYVAHGPMRTLPAGLAQCESLTDLEVFQCPEMTEYPKVLAEIPKLKALIFSCNAGVTPEKMVEGLQYMNTAAANRESRLQILQTPAQPITYLPDLTNLQSLALLSIQSCGIQYIEKAFGKEHLFSQFIANDNEISSLPVDAEGYFIGLHNEYELLSFARNKFTEFPNVFDAESVFTIGTVDFSSNQITKLQGADDGTWRGIKLNILNLSFNKFKEFPTQFFTENDNCSTMSYLMLAGSNMETVAEEALQGKYTSYLVSIDLSRNHLTELPRSFNAETFPYLYGVDLSYNRFARFETKPLNSASLTAYIFRGQRDEKGNRCMKEWPVGIGKHRGLRALFLGSNDIRKVNDLELSPSIFNFEIVDNPNITIDVTRLCPYITAHRMFFAYDPTQDIRGCDALELE